MKTHEKKAIWRALEKAQKDVELNYTEEELYEIGDERFKREIINRALQIAQIRAGRTYDNITQQELIVYAKAILC